MIVYEFKVKAKELQYRAIDEAIRTSQFIQNKCLRYWMDNKNISKYDLNKYCAILAEEFPLPTHSTRWLDNLLPKGLGLQ